ncbi:class I adenylate-forming enzyme family protein [Mycolicibacterium sp. XJ1819]
MTDLTFHSIIDAPARAFPDRVAVIHEGRTATFRQIADSSARLAGTLARRGIGTGDRVAFIGSTGIEAVVLGFAVSRLGAMLAPLNPAASTGERQACLDLIAPAMTLSYDGSESTVAIGDLLDSQSTDAPTHEADERLTHVVFLTSGTTGAPKGVEISQRASWIRSRSLAPAYPRGPFLCLFPFFHMAGWTLSQASWMVGTTVVFADGGDTDAIIDAVQTHAVERTYVVPPVLRRILESGADAATMPSLTTLDTGSSSIARDLITMLWQCFPNCQTSIAYGSTEAGVVSVLPPHDVARRYSSVGPPLPGVEARLADEELWVRTPALFTRYIDDSVATSKVLHDGWYRTGELGEISDDGYLTIRGRATEIIRTGAETVSPSEVEAVLRSYPGIDDVAVIGLPDPDWGEIVTAVVVTNGPTPAVDELRNHCAGRLSRHKHPRRVLAMPGIPRTASTQQVQRKALLSQVLQSGELMER